MWTSDLGDGMYQNPIVYADYSDPDVIRVGEDFFMTASSFTYSPGLPILHSKDLVNWKVVNYALERMPYPSYDLPQHGKGVWAPALRYHNNEFYIYFGAPDEGVFMVKTKDPFGKWEAPVLVKQAHGWIDTCPFWDEDGKAYLVHAFAKSRCGVKSILHINEMSPDGKTLLDEGTLVVDGRMDNPTIEGPKLYKRNGYYYIFAPAGGVEHGWQMVYRSKNIYGPYEERIVLAQGNTPVNGPHQGGYVELESGESWFIHFQDLEPYGRILHLQPMRWVNDWPEMGQNIDENGLGEPVLIHRKPNVGATYPTTVPETSDDFTSKTLGLQWQWQANYKDSFYSLENQKLKLYAKKFVSEEIQTLYEMPNLLTQMLQMPVFDATVKVTLKAHIVKDQCGLALTGKEYHYVSLIKEEEGTYIQFVEGREQGQGSMERIKIKRKVDVDTIYLRASMYNESNVLEDGIGQLAYSLDGINFEKIGLPFYTYPGGWVGTKIGLFTTNFSVSHSKGYALFDYIEIEEGNK